MNLRRMEERAFKCMMIISLGIVMVSLASIIAIVVIRGAPALSLSMIFETPQGGYYLGKGGGIANAIVGSLYLAFGGLALSAVISLPVAFALQREYANRHIANATRIVLDILWGVPSIVIGAFGFVVMQLLGMRTSLLGGIVVLAVLMLPIMTRAIEEIIKMIPTELKEVSYSMGATRLETTLGVVVRQAVPGIVMALMLAFTRGIGDAASILFTSGYTDRIPASLFDSAASLPLAIFFQLGTPIAEVQQRAYASALVLLAIILSVSVAARLLSRRFSKYILK